MSFLDSDWFIQYFSQYWRVWIRGCLNKYWLHPVEDKATEFKIIYTCNTKLLYKIQFASIYIAFRFPFLETQTLQKLLLDRDLFIKSNQSIEYPINWIWITWPLRTCSAPPSAVPAWPVWPWECPAVSPSPPPPSAEWTSCPRGSDASPPQNQCRV